MTTRIGAQVVELRHGWVSLIVASPSFAALRAKTGEEVWNVDLKATFGAKAGTWAMAENLTIEGERLFCLPGGDKALRGLIEA